MSKIKIKIVIEVDTQTEDEEFYVCENCGGFTSEPIAKELTKFYTEMGVPHLYVELCDCP